MKKNKGITIISLVITIILMMIIVSITITSISGSENTISQAQDSKKRLELQEVQQAVFENYIKYKQTGNEEYLIGKKISSMEDLNKYGFSEEFTFTDEDYSNYYLIDNKKDLEKLGLKGSIKNYDQELNNIETDDQIMDEYIVNYKTAEVFNYTTKKTAEGTLLYIKGKE